MVFLISGASHTGKTVLAQKMLERGISDKTVADIFFNNALGVIAKCCM